MNLTEPARIPVLRVRLPLSWYVHPIEWSLQYSRSEGPSIPLMTAYLDTERRLRRVSNTGSYIRIVRPFAPENKAFQLNL